MGMLEDDLTQFPPKYSKAIDYTAERDKMATLLTIASHNRKEAEQEERLALANYQNACVSYGRHNPHALAGKSVKRIEVRRGTWDLGFRNKRTPDKEVTVRGKVTLCEQAKAQYRNHYSKPGEWFVLSASGQTAYSLEHGEWEAE